MNPCGQERLEVGSHHWCRPPKMGDDHDGMEFCGESWCHSVNPKSLQREFSAPGQRRKLKKCLSATGLLVTGWDRIAWKMICVLHFSSFTLCSLCDRLLVNFAHYNADLSHV